MRAAIAGRDTLALMPTGSGKSLTYQLAAMLRPEPTLVLSPLIALMKDQVDKLPPQIAATATFVNSSLTAEETAERLAGVSAGDTRLVYAAPERLRQSRFVELLATVGIGLVVVDEVHCVSMWGHDFRPDYLFIRRGLEALGEPTLLGMTATATPETARDIGQALGRTLEVVHTSVMRPNLRYDVAGGRQRRGSARDPRRATRARSAAARRSCTRDRAARPRSSRACSAVTDFEPSTTTPVSRREERTRVQDDFVVGRDAGRRRHDGVRHGHRQARRAARLPRQLPGLARGVRADGGPRGARRRAEPDAPAREPERCDGAPALRGLGRAHARPSSARSTAPSGTRAGSSTPTSSPPLVPERDARVLVGMLEQAGLLRRDFDEGRLMRIELAAAPDDARERVDALLDRARLVAESRADRIVAFAETRVVPARAGRGALRRGVLRAVRRLRRLRAADPRIRVDLEPAASAARRRRRGDRRRGRVPHVAARAAQPRRDAARLAEGAPVRTPLLCLPTARGGDRRRRPPLGAARRGARARSSR